MAYAGAPLRTPEGHVLGSLCVIDRRPRPEGLSEARRNALRALDRQGGTQLERRRFANTQRQMLDQREIVIRTQASVAAARGDLPAILDTLVTGAMAAVPHAEGAGDRARLGRDRRRQVSMSCPPEGVDCTLVAPLSGFAS